jgi:hypothetical protein
MKNFFSSSLGRMICLFLSISVITASNAQIPTANSFSSQVNYTGNYSYGVNQGYYPGWSAENTATIATGSSVVNVKGVGVKSFRVPLYDDFLSTWGLTVELGKFQAYANLGADDNTAFVGSPDPSHRDPTTYPGTTEPSKTFKNLYEPIWLDLAQTQVNPNNYYAKYLYDVVKTYGAYVKFWEVVNEPDFTYSSAGWIGDQNPLPPGSWFDHNPTPDELVNLRAPVFSYIRMLRISWEVIKKLQPNDFVCVGGIGYRSFLDAVLRNSDNPTDGTVNTNYPAKGGSYFDIVSYHSYPMYNVTVGNRQSDAAATSYIATKNSMDALASTYGYNGLQYPKKQFICTETGVSRIMSGSNWGSNDGQRNYIIKASVLSQKNSIRQVYWFSLGDGTDGTNPHERMGLYYYFGGNTPYNQTASDQGKALKTTSDQLYGKTYDAARTSSLNLPSSVEGAAFRAADGSYTYVLWAKTTGDLSEYAGATYSFPNTVVASANLVRKEWDFSETNNATTISKTNITLTGSPSFFSETAGASASGNQGPIANAGADQKLTLPANSTTLVGTASDPGGILTSYAWSQVSGPAQTSLLSPLQLNTLLNNLVQGTYQFELKVTDNLGAVGKDTVQVTVNAAPSSGGTSTRIEAENYTSMSGVQTENTTDIGGGQNVGYIDTGDWMDYNVSIASAGSYPVNVRVASPGGGQLQIKNSAGTVVATVTVPNTGGYQSWQTVTATITLPAGSQTLRIYSASNGWNFNWWEIGSTGGTTPPPPTTTSTRIEAENYTNMNGVQKETTTDAGGGQNVGYIDTGDWMDYSVSASAAGTYSVNLRVASPSGGQLQIQSSTGAVLATVAVPNTGGYQNWQTVSANIALAAGTQTIRIYSTSTGWNFNWWEIAGAGSSTPPPPTTGSSTHIEAENYTSMSGVQTENTTDIGGGQNVGYIDTGDWMDYNVSIASAGSYPVNVRVASPGGGQLQIKNSAGTVVATVTVPNTGGYQSWQTVTATITLPAGSQTLRIYSASNGWNFNWWEIGSTGGTTPPPPTTTSTRIEAENYTNMNGVQKETTTDAGGGQNVGYIDTGDWMDYSVSASAAGTYSVNLRVASPSGGQLQIQSSTGAVLATVDVPNTGGYQNWQTVSANIALAAGTQTIRIYSTSTGWNFNWWEMVSTSGTIVAKTVSVDSILTTAPLVIYPNATSGKFQLQINNDLTGAVNIEIYDTKGIVQKQFSLSKTEKGGIQFYLSIATLPVANYTIKVTMGDWSDSDQVIKQ